MRPGSVCRHLKIAGRVPISQFFHVASQRPRKLQHIQLGARIGIVWTLFRALGPAKENKHALESLDANTMRGYWELKRKFRLQRLPRTYVLGYDCVALRAEKRNRSEERRVGKECRSR